MTVCLSGSTARLSPLDCCLSPQSTRGELLHISLVMLVTSIFFLWFAWDAIICENAFALLASGVLGLAVCARIIYYVVRRTVSLPTYAPNLLQHLAASCTSVYLVVLPALRGVSNTACTPGPWARQHPGNSIHACSGSHMKLPILAHMSLPHNCYSLAEQLPAQHEHLCNANGGLHWPVCSEQTFAATCLEASARSCVILAGQFMLHAES